MLHHSPHWHVRRSKRNIPWSRGNGLRAYSVTRLDAVVVPCSTLSVHSICRFYLCGSSSLLMFMRVAVADNVCTMIMATNTSNDAVALHRTFHVLSPKLLGFRTSDRMEFPTRTRPRELTIECTSRHTVTVTRSLSNPRTPADT